MRVVESAVGSPSRPLLLAQTSALDPDEGLNAELSYSLVIDFEETCNFSP